MKSPLKRFLNAQPTYLRKIKKSSPKPDCFALFSTIYRYLCLTEELKAHYRISTCMQKPLNELEKKIKYSFKNKELANLSCIHKSFGNENRAEHELASRDNERLEFLGDAILDLIVSELLINAFPDSPEGELSKLRAGLVNEKTLALVARELELGDFIALGKGEGNTGGRQKDSILSSTFEAILAAIYLDSGFSEAQAWIKRLFAERVENAKADDPLQDYKTRLQELAQARFKVAPRYEVIQSLGPDHDKTFEVQLLIDNQTLANGSGKSKKEAEQNAAKIALTQLNLTGQNPFDADEQHIENKPIDDQ